MPSLTYKGRTFTLQDQQSILEGLENQGEVIPNSCRSGLCQSCLMHAVSGTPTSISQQGLKETLISQNYFLACKCIPTEDLDVSLPSDSAVSIQTTVLGKELLAKDVLCLRLLPQETFSCNAGQYINVVKDDLIRSYSVANLPDADGYLELHIKRLPEGRMSNWLHDSIAIHDPVTIRGPAGNCFYNAIHDRNFPIVLAGTGTGLAPLEGIVTDALDKGHDGEITLIHGAMNKSGIYHEEKLIKMADFHHQFTYIQSLMESADPANSDLNAEVRSVLENLDLSRVKVYLCGSPALVNKLKTRVFLQGVPSYNIFSDPFITATTADWDVFPRNS